MYNNSAIQTLQRVLQGATGEDVVDFAQQRLFGPLGMTHTKMTTDRAGNAQMFEGVQSTCRDLARFGQLMLDGGTWDGHRVVSSAWIAEATGKSSTTLNAGYGYLWWVNHEGARDRSARGHQPAGGRRTRRPRTGASCPARRTTCSGRSASATSSCRSIPGAGPSWCGLGTAEPRPTPPTFGPAQASQVVTQAVVH